MKKLAVGIVCLILIVAAVTIYAQTVYCPIDNSSAYFTGKTKTAENGKQLWLYKCTQFGHEFWVVK